MAENQQHRIGDLTVSIASRDGVGQPTCYSLLLAEAIPELGGCSVVDIGIGSGILAIVAALRGARRVYVLDTFDTAIDVTMENAATNGVTDQISVLAPGGDIVPLPANQHVDVMISNPAQLPLPKPERENSPYYAGPEGRVMIDLVVEAAARRLTPGGRLFMTHNSLTDIPRTFRMMESLGLTHRILAETSLAFRSFIDRDWLDQIGGAPAGLYELRDGTPYEAIKVIEATHS